jgi:hypothetical protein
MLRVSTFLSVPLFLAALLVAGCQKPADKSDPRENAAPQGGHEHGPAAKSGSPHPDPLPKGEGTLKNPDPLPMGEGTMKSAETEKPAALSAEDRALIEKQKVCPVSGGALGSMGDPVKVVVKGQTVFLCCAGCEEAIKKDPDKYLAKLKK